MKSAKRSAMKMVVLLATVTATAVMLPQAQGARRGSSRTGTSGTTSRNNQKAQNAQNQRNNAAAAKNKAAVDAARVKVNEAQAELAKANRALEDLVGPMRAKFESSPEMVAAQAALSEAQAERDKAAAAVGASLQNNANYQVALVKKDQAEAALDKVKKEGGTQEQITAAAGDVMTVGSTASQIRGAAESSDTNLVQARSKLVAASAKVSELNHQFQESLKADPQWIDAKKAIEDANVKLAAANKALDAALAGTA